MTWAARDCESASRTLASLDPLVTDTHMDQSIASDGDRIMFGPYGDSLTMKPEAQLQCRPLLGEGGIDREGVGLCPQPEEPVGQCLPDAAHGGQMQSPHSGAGQIAEVESRRQPEELEGPFGLPGACEQRSRYRRRQRAAMGSAGLVEGEGCGQGVRDHLLREKVVKHEHVGLLDEL